MAILTATDQSHQKRIITWVALSLCTFTAFTYYFNVFCRFDQLIILTQESIVNNSAPSPNRYRLLIPFANEWLSQFLYLVIGKTAKGSIFYITMTAIFAFNYYAFIKFFQKIEMNNLRILISLFILTIFFTAGMNHHSYQPWSYLEPALYTLGALCILSTNRFLWFALISSIAVINRETGIFLSFIPLFHFLSASKFLSKANIKYLVVLAFNVGLLLTIRYMAGTTPEVQRIFEILQTNMEPMNLILLIPLLISSMIFFVFVKSPYLFPIKNMKYLVILYLIPVCLFGRWIEIRMLLPFSFYFIPVIAYAITWKFIDKEPIK